MVNYLKERPRKFYGIPQATVSDHIRGRVSDGALPGRQLEKSKVKLLKEQCRQQLWEWG